LTKIATVSFRNSSGRVSHQERLVAPLSGGFSGAVALALILLTGLVGCKSSSHAGSGDGGAGGSCATQVASTSGTATPLTSAQSVQNKICFEGSSNWYVINVPSGNTLLDVAAGYPTNSNTPVNLDVKVFYKTNSTTLTQVQDLVASSQSDAGSNSIQTTLQVLQSGAYYLQVADHTNVNFDATNAYTLSAGYAVDPDTHEPNDTIADAKPSDTKPGYLAYLGDLDIFTTSVASTTDLLNLSITNPKTAPASINYIIASAAGTVLSSGSASPQDQPTTTLVTVAASGAYYVTLSYPTGTIPNRTATGAYQLSFTSVKNPDTLNNHTLATAVCPGGGTGPCNMAFSGSIVNLPAVSSYISVQGQRDFYRVDVTSGAALVLQINLTASSSTSVKYAVDLLTADPNSACQADTDCTAINLPCATTDVDGSIANVSGDCELSHQCLQSGPYKFCSGGSSCQLCAGASLCIPNASGGGGLCAIPQYLSSFSPMGTPVGGSTVYTAQPLFSNGTYYLNVHDVNYGNVDLTNPYTLNLVMAPEPDPNDQSTVAAQRNNFYNPYPSSMSDESPNRSRAKDITAEVTAGQPVTGYISYQGDDDWYSFQHPCPGKDCALSITWTQPGPSPVQVAFFMLDNDLNTVHESFAYSAGATTALMNPVMSSFDNQDCTKCSFASSTQTNGDGGPPYIYYMRVTDRTEKHWDFSSVNTGEYSFTITKGADTCPTACSYYPTGVCGCYCPEAGTCPGPSF
jgi:hypothetical protein